MRKIAIWVFGLAWAAFIGVYAFPFATQWLTERGAFQNTTEQINRAMSQIAVLKQALDRQTMVVVAVGALGLSTGFLLGISANSLWQIRRPEKPKEKNASPKDKETPPTNEPRNFIDVAPQFLTGLYSGRTTAQAEKIATSYLGKWLRVTGLIANVAPKKDWDKVYVQMWADGPRGDGVLIGMSFPMSLRDRLELFPLEHEITVEGKISDIDRTSVTLADCSLVSDRSSRTPTSGREAEITEDR